MNNQFLYKGKKVFIILMCIIFIFSSLVMPANANNSPEKSGPGILPDYHPTNSSDKSIIVKYKDEKKISFVKQTISQKLNNYKVNIKRNLGNIDIIETSDEAEYEMVLHELKNNPYIEYAQPDYKLKKLDIGLEDLSSKQWSIANSGQSIIDQTGVSGIDINVQPVWNYQKGNENVIVGILDSGIDIDHPELKDSIYVNKKEIAGNNEDDDHNGYIDDINGWDFMNSDSSVYDNSEEDFHATHIAGIIAGKHDDKGINGIAPGVKILPLKFMNVNGGFTSDAIEAIRYAKSMGVKVINCSFGDTNYNYALEKEMRDSGILFVCGSGNENENLDSNSFFLLLLIYQIK
ncbi:S8 family serine peptidase [Pseudobacteroides cellulosolvens]|uniref:Peptidase S8 and S53 subtilisin kexin sedolisin n=1 Tax=Pseudobacteroides cellulosolvens ATCC 35603 = DSM 2933 TaxID=398512 RepID=A0A0L6JTS5_9FIRM|nr:S8 family serine peptidase [Pseudobacteroides cellulosolvens]KNY29198.1 peptidase S8 and S53 subtilisin kexin sedolisin [Pseudobacteroides cellulosolvens ATCC 35603 = DSM 2933]